MREQCVDMASEVVIRRRFERDETFGLNACSTDPTGEWRLDKPPRHIEVDVTD
jgi:hypothetical protein